jgi:hypothetical protein
LVNEPTAVQDVKAVQETPESVLKVAPVGLGGEYCTQPYMPYQA